MGIVREAIELEIFDDENGRMHTCRSHLQGLSLSFGGSP
jgi:hypothetical protein